MRTHDDGRIIPPCFPAGTTPAYWEARGRQTLLRLIGRTEYGFPPLGDFTVTSEETDAGPACAGGRGTAVRLRLTCSAGRRIYRFPLSVFLPAGRENSPCVLFLNNRSPGFHDIHRLRYNPFFPVRELLRAGYAAAAFHVGDVQPDDPRQTGRGIMGAMAGMPFAEDAPWGALCAWSAAACLSRTVLARLPAVDPRRVYVAGHSRGGKAALWAGALDTAFAGVFASCSGCGGAALHRGKEGERVGDITRLFPHWFTPSFQDWAGLEDSLPFDQHHLLGLIAPRPLFITSATEDSWADPLSEFLSLRAAAPFWALYGEQGLPPSPFPEPGRTVRSACCGYRLRRGVHDLTRQDWLAALRFFTRRDEVSPCP
ncbi:MAG: acetylxylan esterase [Christensenellales bacterium]|jgi:hypothetical protein